MSVRIYVPPERNAAARVFLLESYAGRRGSGGLYEPKYPFSYSFTIAERMEAADIVLLPQAVSVVTEELKAYVAPILAEAKQHKLPVLVFVSGDLSHNVYLDGCYMLKGTQFQDSRRAQDIIVPPICEDLGSHYGVVPRKKSTLPHVGFCGWSGFNSIFEFIKYSIRVACNEIVAVFSMNPHVRARRKGLYFRRRALNALKGSKHIKTDFIERNSFGAHQRTIVADPKILREEFVNVIVRNDFTITPKGDANYSVRFYETLSLGRIPILIDTLCCLPFEDTLAYDSFILRVPYTDINSLEHRLCSFYNSLTPERFESMQKIARNTFETYLRYDSFFNRLFEDIKSNKERYA